MTAADELTDFYDQRVTVLTLESSGSWGDEYTHTSDVPCFLDESRNIVLDQNGQEVVSMTTLTGPVDTAELYTPGSQVKLPTRTATVISVGVARPGVLDLPAHVEVSLT